MARKPTPQATIDAVNADLRARYGSTITRQQFLQYSKDRGIWPGWIRTDKRLHLARGLYAIPEQGFVPQRSAPSTKRRSLTPEVLARLHGKSDAASLAPLTEEQLNAMTTAEKLEAITTRASQVALVPAIDPTFVPFGDFAKVRQLVASEKFCPVYIAGMSGNGKSMQVEQACAQTGREYIRLQMTTETDEDDLLGGFRLVNGSTVFALGPMPVAMLRGAVALIDEIDYSSPKISCLQSILEGKPVLLKKLGVVIRPKPGFTVFATANTKGRGSEDGRYVGTNVLNDALLERFPITIEQEYPSAEVEQTIMRLHYEKLGHTLRPTDAAHFEVLAKWADTIRQTFVEGGVDDLISTRRLTHIVSGYSIFGDLREAVRLCVNRFDLTTRTAFLSIFDKCMPEDDEYQFDPNF